MSERSSTTIGERARRALLFGALTCAMLLLSCGAPSASEEAQTVRVAAASDLTSAFEEISKAFEKKTGKKTKVTFGSTGLLSKQIIDGAPFDVFAAANVSFVDEVVAKAGCDGETKTLYARGRIVLYTTQGDAVKDLSELTDARFTKIAIANPEHAPYGKAAQEALTTKGLWDGIKGKLVYGENVSQTLQFAESGNAEVAIVALSLAIVAKGKYTLVDDALHKPLEQALVVCGKPERAGPAKEFAAFIGSPEGRSIMKRFGFLLPGEALPVAEK